MLGAGLRLLWLRTPLLDGHRWRQVDTAAIARNLYEGGFHVFHPEVDWGGKDGYVESEFPLLPAIAATLYSLFGQEDYFGRLVSVVFSTGTIAATFALAAELVGPAGGLAAAFLVAVSPASIFFGRTFMPDSTMLFFWVFGVFAFVKYFKTGTPRWLVIGSVSATLACLAKIPAVMMFAPIAGAAWQARGRAVFRDRNLIVACAVPLVITLAWYVHAFMLYEQTGLTFGILVHPAKTYPIWISPGPWKYAFSKYSTFEQLAQKDFYVQMLGRVHHFLLLPWGLAGALIGFVTWKRATGRLVADAWLFAMALFILVMGEANISHEYYQLPLVPLAALYFGACAGPIFEGSWALLRGNGAGKVAALAIIGVAGFYYSGVILTHFRPDGLDIRMLQAGQAMGRVVPEDATSIVVDDYGITSPMLLYFAHRKGWSFGPDDLYPQVLDGLRHRGARYFVTTAWSDIERIQPDAAIYLKMFPRVVLPPDAPGNMMAFDIGAEPSGKNAEAAR
jgi:4-amino-4-deoxy-L-arabinose transferase-like glycosyltransferase